MNSLVKLIAPTLLLAGCASLDADQQAQTQDGAYEVSEVHGPSPTVVFEAGLGAYKEEWRKIFPVVAATHAAFAYDRPGVGRSEATTRPRDGATIVEDLRRLLRARGFAPPFVLVGHSAGGLDMQLFARLHPQEVAGLVLVDPTHPAQFIGEGAMDKRPLLSQFVVAAVMTRAAKAEFAALDQTGREALAAPPPPADMPIMILIAPDASGDRLALIDNAKRADFARLYPHATLRAVAGGHNIPGNDPQAVLDAIAEVLAHKSTAANALGAARP